MERFIAAVGLFLVWVLPVFAQSVEPNAGKWKTWIISSGKDFRVPPPPDDRTTQSELAWIRDVGVATPNPDIAGSVNFWSAGAPAYRWIELINNRALRAASLSPSASRLYAYVAMAMYDATIATWDSKYAPSHPLDCAVAPVAPMCANGGQVWRVNRRQHGWCSWGRLFGWSVARHSASQRKASNSMKTW